MSSKKLKCTLKRILEKGRKWQYWNIGKREVNGMKGKKKPNPMRNTNKKNGKQKVLQPLQSAIPRGSYIRFKSVWNKFHMA